ncbi:helix-turn-helix transcriptional regulator [Algicola sagamiensis]|uniref:helix-turn-helix transcriptional regulator n=1 Tax=Algicola sagamiensis TaxID=163869 RepID=UPI0003772714|nr:AraC family transcriptional regulator [Algicola sagamiensis]
MSHSDSAIEVGDHAIPVLLPDKHAAQTDHMFHFLLEGEYTMDLGEPVQIQPGMMMLIPSGVPHYLVSGKDIRITYASFCVQCLQLDESDPLLAPFVQVRLGAVPVFPIPKERHPYLLTLFNELKKETQRVTPESFTLSRCLLLLLLGEIVRASHHNPLETQRPSGVSAAMAYIEKHCLHPISLKDVASAVHYSPAYLATAFKKATGFTVGAWINQHRLAQACSRLLHTDEKVDAIAQQVGWQDVTHFIRQFKKAYGMTPAAWRKHKTQDVTE